MSKESKTRIEEIQDTLKETTERSMKLDRKLSEAFENGKTDEVDLDFVGKFTGSLRTTVKSATAEILAGRAAKNRLK